MDNSKESNNKLIIISTIIFSLLAHIYCWTNSLFSHDDLWIQITDDLWQVQIGRFLQPAYAFLRGRIISPFLIAILGVTFLILAIITICKIFKIKNKYCIITLCGVLSTNVVLTCLNSAFIYHYDTDLLAFFLSALAVYLCINYKHGYLLGSICIAASLAFFQSFYEVTIVLFMFYILFELLKNKNCTKLIIKSLATLILGGIVYYIGYSIALHIYNTELAIAPNSIAGVGNYTGYSVIELLKGTYQYFIDYMLHPKTFNSFLVADINIIMFVGLVYVVIESFIKNKISLINKILVIILILLLPFGINCIYFLTKGFIHELMIYSFFLYYLLVICFFEYYFENHPKNTNKYKAIHILLIVFLGTVTYNAIVYSNQVYVKKELEDKATLSVMTRIIDEMEHFDDYVPGQTPVLILGDLSKNYKIKKIRFEEDLSVAGAWNDYAVSYPQTYYWYFDYVLGYRVNLKMLELGSQYKNLPEVGAMPSFPSKGYMQMINGVLVIKVSDDLY